MTDMDANVTEDGDGINTGVLSHIMKFMFMTSGIIFQHL